MKAVVVGCGIVGLAAAHALSDEAYQVTVPDRDGPAAGASRGNAGWFVHTDIMPIASPRVWRQLPHLLCNPLGPLSIQSSYLPALLPWLVRFAVASRPAAVGCSVEALAALQINALPAWMMLAQQLLLDSLIHRRGGLYAHHNRTNFEAAKPQNQRQRELGIEVNLISADAIVTLEPARVLQGLPEFDTGTVWMSLRPSLPDSQPVIGPSRASRNVIYAFGHGHYGLTQAAITVRLAADLAAGRPTRIDLASYSAQRF
jgi:glycine/D-amino acid oxidase-like deaminating enzyme